MNWDKYDLLFLEGIAVEVKSSGYLQSWDQDKLSSLGFGIQPIHGWDKYEMNRLDNRIFMCSVFISTQNRIQ